jgi:prevent-host-death family protein
MKTVTASAANRQFSSLLREVSEGHRVLVTSRGKPVATIEPYRAASRSNATMSAAKRRLMEHLKSMPVMGKRKWARDELYD